MIRKDLHDLNELKKNPVMRPYEPGMSSYSGVGYNGNTINYNSTLNTQQVYTMSEVNSRSMRPSFNVGVKNYEENAKVENNYVT